MTTLETTGGTRAEQVGQLSRVQTTSGAHQPQSGNLLKLEKMNKYLT